MQSADSRSRTVRLGTRGSPLALAQAEAVRASLAAAHGGSDAAFAVVPIKTTGDRITERPLAQAGGKGLFTKEIDEALLAGRIDAAVHSAKDMVTQLPDGMVIAACLKRGDVRDAFISPVAARLDHLPRGAVVGTSSLRRKALALRARADLVIVDMRGNVATRLGKLADGQIDATILAFAGLMRLALAERVTALLAPDDWLPAVGQGAIAITARADDRRMLDLLTAIDDRATSIALVAERAFLTVLDGSCRTPIGGLARVVGDEISFRGIIIKPDGSDAHEVRRNGRIGAAQEIGGDAGAELAGRGGADFFSVA